MFGDMMDLSDQLVTTRKISATLSADDIKGSALNFVKTRLDLARDAVIRAESAAIQQDGSVLVTVEIEHGIVPTPAADPAPAETPAKAPAAASEAPAINLSVVPRA